METLKAIFKRRSVRKYKDMPVEEQKIREVLRTAMAAPTARNVQDWEFLVINTLEGRQKIMDAHPYASMLKTAPVAVIVCSNRVREEGAQGYGPINCAAAIQTMLLAATDMGLGSVWLGVFPRPERVMALKEAFALPEDITPIGIAVFGYADEEIGPSERYDKEKIHWEKWR